jgi:endoglucanase
LLFCEDFESSALGTPSSAAWTIERNNSAVTIDATHARGGKALHITAPGGASAFLVPNAFAPANNSFFGRMWVWVDAFPTRPDYAHFTLVEASGTGNGTFVRPVGGQYIPGRGYGAALWGTGADGGPTGDWMRWQESTPAVGGRWTCFEWQMQSATNSLTVWIDGIVRPELSASTQDHGGNNVDFVFPAFNKVKFGWQLYQGGSTPANIDVWIDDLALSSSRVGCGSGVAASTGLQWRGTSLAGAEFGETRLPGTYNTDYVYPSKSSADYFKSKGMNVSRLPFLWERLQPALNQPFDATEWSRLKAFVDQVTATGMLVMLDPHNYARYRGNLVGSSAVPNAAFADLWSRLATAFKNNPKVVFGLMNEPHDMSTEQWLSAANAAIAAIRAAGATNVITVPGNGWTGAYSWLGNGYGTPNGTVMKGVVDPGNNFVFELHQYLDGDSSGKSATCTSATIGAERLAEVTAWLRSNGRRAVLGELGAASNDTCNQAVAGTLAYLKANADVWSGWVWWAAGPWWGDYMYSIEPANNTDKPQMSVLQPYLR